MQSLSVVRFHFWISISCSRSGCILLSRVCFYIVFGCILDIFLCAFHGRERIEGILNDEPLTCENSGQVNEREVLLFYAQLIQKCVEVSSNKCARVVKDRGLVYRC